MLLFLKPLLCLSLLQYCLLVYVAIASAIVATFAFAVFEDQ